MTKCSEELSSFASDLEICHEDTSCTEAGSRGPQGTSFKFVKCRVKAERAFQKSFCAKVPSSHPQTHFPLTTSKPENPVLKAIAASDSIHKCAPAACEWRYLSHALLQLQQKIKTTCRGKALPPVKLKSFAQSLRDPGGLKSKAPCVSPRAN